ncbi:hypothetical protein C7212DRAFT_314595 [Tuber magnatum]|uniref:Uncharacterized protein n=1 Tax=Tuber magnatum TaxID=42249 RepID=A0A317SWJ7_9PEZI|nr:hypothetical protein C7212DRAFT_314595 [Tuber magnatum]
MVNFNTALFIVLFSIHASVHRSFSLDLHFRERSTQLGDGGGIWEKRKVMFEILLILWYRYGVYRGLGWEW